MIILIAAIDQKRAIGKGGTLPWRLSEDLKRFKETTMGHTLLMGRKTYESIGGPLPGREILMLTRGTPFRDDGVRSISSLDEALEEAKKHEKFFVAGGGEIYHQMLPYADQLVLTRIQDDFGGDTFFPEFASEFKLKTSSIIQGKSFVYTYDLLERRTDVSR